MSHMHLKDREIDAIDRAIICATQDGLPLVPRPYDEVAQKIGQPASEVKKRFARMLDCGIIRRIGVVPNHYRLGFGANGMSVWDLPDERVIELGEVIGALDYVSHCYKRPRHLPSWPYNLFAMVHGKNLESVEEKIAAIAAILGEHCRSHDVLYSTKILKKTGLRLCSQEKKNV